MLDVNNVNFNTLPKSYRKDRRFDNSMKLLSWEQRLKRRKKEELNFKTKRALVPNTNVWEKKRAPRSTFFCRPFCFPYLFSAGSFVYRRSAGPAVFFHGVIQTIGKTPLNTKNVLPSTRNAGDFQFQLNWQTFIKTDEQTNETKMQMNLRKQIKTQECNKCWHKTTVS
jgi:hypothetical protein